MKIVTNIINELKFNVNIFRNWLSIPKTRDINDWTEHNFLHFAILCHAQGLIKKAVFVIALPAIFPIVFLFMEMMAIYELVSDLIKAPYRTYKAMGIFKKTKSDKEKPHD